MGFEPFMFLGVILTLGGIFIFPLLALGILFTIIGFARQKARPDTYKGSKKALFVLLTTILVPVYAFFVKLVAFGKVS